MRVQVVVTHDGQFWESLTQFVQQCHQGGFLHKGARVAGTTVLVKSALITDTDGVGVVPLAMCPNLGQRPTYPNRAIYSDIVVVADAVESSLTMPAVDVLHRHPLVGERGGAVDNGEGTDSLSCPILYGWEQNARHIESRVIDC